MRAVLKILLGCGLVLLSLTAKASGSLSVDTLKCDYRTNPLGIRTSVPHLSWVLYSSERGARQTAYQILAASTADKLTAGKADLWDSSKVSQAESVDIAYGGKPLASRQKVFWKVRAWGGDDRPSNFSKVATFELGLNEPSDWKASWITRKVPEVSEADLFNDHPAPLFRKEFKVGKAPRQARIYVCGLGYYELRLNGQRVGDQVLDPGWTTYAKRVLYSTYDVTKQLQKGPNAIGAMLGNGWFNPLPLRLWGKINLREHLTIGQPQLLLQLVIDYADGSSDVIVTDRTWHTSNGPILRNNVYLGEVYDARKEHPDWDKPGFNDSAWEAAELVSADLGRLEAQQAPPIRVTRTLKPVRLTEPKPGTYIFDLGQNFAGWARLRVSGPAGTKVRLRYGELLYPDGTLNGMTAVCGQIKQGGTNYIYPGKGAPKTAWQQDEYILRGNGPETYTPRFTFHGFRYVEVTGLPGKATLDTITGLRLNSDVAPAGSFTCSNPLFNRIQEMVLWTELSNLFSVQSDCPHREKFGYGGDIVAASEMALLNFDMSGLYTKAVEDLSDAVRSNGGFTETAPFVGISDEGLGEKSGPIGWGTAHPLLQWQLYQYYGDKRLLSEQYENTRRWMSLLEAKAIDGILDNGISDHESLAPKPRALTGTAFFYLNAQLFSRICRILGKSEEARNAEALAERIKTAFNEKFLRPENGQYASGSQACQGFPLYMGLVPDAQKQHTLGLLLQDIQQHNDHLTTGIFGTKYLLNCLTDLDRADVASHIVSQRTFPGWGYMLEQGATTLWEHWAFSDNTYSHNHPMFGSVSEWFFKALAGIQPAPEAFGFNRIILNPNPVNEVDWVTAQYRSVRGPVISEWKRHGKEFDWKIQIPVGASAIVLLPASDIDQAREGKTPVAKATGVEVIRIEKGRAVLELSSGTYRFKTML